MRRLITLLASITLMVACATTNSNNTNNSESDKVVSTAKYIFYFIGDGMAAPQVRLGEAALSSDAFQSNYCSVNNIDSRPAELYLKSLTTTGLATSNAHNRYITDSAAAGTALATGNKTNVGVISQSPSGERLTTMAEMAHSKGMKVGIVSSVSIDHATPACFYAHATSRNLYSDISDQLLTSGFDYFAGGSVKFDSRAKSEYTDKATAYKSYREAAEAKGFRYVTTRSEFDATKSGSPVIATLDMLANEQYTDDGAALPYTVDLGKHTNPSNKITLADFTRKGIELLEDDKEGFFMMVEGGKIDWACHANDATAAAYEVVAFDDAIGIALSFAAKHPKETLIVVTGDHDCGGLTLGFAGTKYESSFDQLAKSHTSHKEFTTLAQSKIEAGASFDELLATAVAEFGLSDLTPYERRRLEEAYHNSKRSKSANNDNYYLSYGGYDPFTVTCTQIVNNKAGLDFSSYSHTAVPVMVFATGVNEALFNGYYDNTDIAKKIITAGGLN